MSKNPTPDGWLTVEEAAQVAGISEEEVRRVAGRIRKGTTYTIMGVTLDYLKRMGKQHTVIGVPPEGPETLPAYDGSELKALHRGRIIVNAEMVAYWKRIQDKIAELTTTGHVYLDELAQDTGIPSKELQQTIKELRKRMGMTK